MRILVTRPEPDALKLKGLIEEHGDHSVAVEPLLRVVYHAFDAADLDGVTGLIATSRNALRALRTSSALAKMRKLRVYAVGAATAMEARRLGFETIVKGSGTAEALVPIIASTLDPMEEMLLHLRGSKVASDLRGDLEGLGFHLVEAIVYEMRAAEMLSEAIRDEIADGSIEAVMLMSPETASIYGRLMTKFGLKDMCRQIVHLCLSEQVALRLKPLGDIPIEIAAEPTIEEMLALIDHAAAKLDL